MSTSIALLGGAVLGMAAGSLLIPYTRRELAAATARSMADVVATTAATDPVTAATSTSAATTGTGSEPQVTKGHRLALAVASGLLPAYVLFRVGWSPNAVPPLLLLVGLVQLAYCDITRRLLPKNLVYVLSATVIVSGLIVAGVTGEWARLSGAAVGALAFFLLFLVINLVNPRWLAFGDVRLSLAVGFGLAWVSPMALVDGFFVANLLAAVVGLFLIAAHRAERRSAVPFGLYLALGAALVLLTWS